MASRRAHVDEHPHTCVDVAADRISIVGAEAGATAVGGRLAEVTAETTLSRRE